jgi:hypothetical protein
MFLKITNGVILITFSIIETSVMDSTDYFSALNVFKAIVDYCGINWKGFISVCLAKTTCYVRMASVVNE